MYSCASPGNISALAMVNILPGKNTIQLLLASRLLVLVSSGPHHYNVQFSRSFNATMIGDGTTSRHPPKSSTRTSRVVHCIAAPLHPHVLYFETCFLLNAVLFECSLALWKNLPLARTYYPATFGDTREAQ